MPSEVRLFGVRHHGPGSARSVVHALTAFDPDVVLIEGPPDANDLLPLARDEALEPPVALLVYVPERPRSAVLYPFAAYSPEWQAIQFALARERPVRFIDLPQSIRLASSPDTQEEETTGEGAAGDPLQPLAEAAGFSDAERWWDRLVESRAGDETEVFSAIHEMMAAVRAQLDGDAVPIGERRREAHMRRAVRAARSEGFARIAVVCGAYHTPALASMPPAREDDALLKGLPKVTTAAAWVPWSYERLSAASGYGAGVESPMWYELLWKHRHGLGARWITRVARILRDEDLPASAAHVIETCRLADALSAVRGHPLPGLSEYTDAAVAVLGAGDPLTLRLVAPRWHFDGRLGRVPDTFPAAPLQRDLAALQKRLRLPPKAEEKVYDLDLREAIDRERSHLLRRLRVLQIEWGVPEADARSSRGTFREVWRLRWQPEFAVALIEASRFGHTIEQAATTRILEEASGTSQLPVLVRLLQEVLFADMAGAVAPLVAAIENLAAAAADVRQLLDAVPPLVAVRRYGNVRETDVDLVDEILAGLVPRLLIAIDPASVGIDDEAAGELWKQMMALTQSLRTLGREPYVQGWYEALTRLAGRDATHPLLSGYAHRTLYDGGRMSADGLEHACVRAVSVGHPAPYAASWVEGLLSGSGAVLVHDDRLRDTIDRWIRAVPEARFVEVLPLLRRTFAQFPGHERRVLGERLRSRLEPEGGTAAPGSADFDETAARAVLPLLARIWSVEPHS